MNLFGLEDRQWLFLATAVYVSTFALGTYSVLRLHRKTGRSYTVALVSFGWILQSIGLYARGLEYGGCPLGNLFELVQFVVWSAIGLYIFVGPAYRVSLLGIFTSGLAGLLSILSLAAPSWDDPSRAPLFGDSPWIETHAALALFSYGVFGVLALTSAMYLKLSHSLKHKKTRGLFPFMPSIVELSQINLRLLSIGFAILSVSLGIGCIYWSSNPDSVHVGKLASTIVVWLVYGALLFLGVRRSIGSKRLSVSSIIVFAAALLSLKAVDDDKSGPDHQTEASGSTYEVTEK